VIAADLERLGHEQRLSGQAALETSLAQSEEVAAVAGYRTGNWADGAVIVFDLLEAVRDGNAVVEGPRKVVGVMHRDAKQYKDTGGWGFEGFKGDSKTDRAVGANAATACYNCHAGQKQKSYVFSAMRD
jgi:hypothetical protein